MNIHNKLLSLGFKKIEPHKLEHDFMVGNKLVPYTELKLVPPKWTFTYVLDFSKTIKVWAIVVKHTDITIYLDSSEKHHKEYMPKNRFSIKTSNVNGIYSSTSGKYPPLTSIVSILQILPTDIKRDVILSKLFG